MKLRNLRTIQASTPWRSGPIFLVLTLISPGGLAHSEDRVDYGRDVLPILSDKCYHCHGPDESARKAKLRLDSRDLVFGIGGKPGVVVPSKPAKSPLVQRITSADPDEMMPPPDSKRKLTPAQIQTLKRWVEQGAPWSQHWAFVAPRKSTPPNTRDSSWVRNDIDRFILARLEHEGLRPSPEADPGTLLRRLTLDLTGLPPTLAELDRFERECRAESQTQKPMNGSKSSRSNVPDKTLNQAIDRLLASPRFGERMAVDWLDIARFADTHGYQADRYRPMWAYRDWVIAAFNRNLPFDQFVTWQLAGDLLPNSTQEQKLATAFNRLHMQNEEGGVVEEEFRVAYVCDRVNTFGTAFLGLTVECARCHDHKYDPIGQRDYYSLFAFFQNIDECGQTSYFTSSMPVPTVLLSTPEQDANRAALKTQIAAKEIELKTLRAGSHSEFESWLAHRPTKIESVGIVARFDFDDTAGNRVPNKVNAKQHGNLQDNPQSLPGKSGKALLLSGENGVTFPGVGNFSRVQPFSISIWLKPASIAPRQVVLHHSRAPVDAGSRGYELLLESGKVAFGMHHMWPGNSLKVRTQKTIQPNQWSHVAVAYDGSSKAAGLRIFVNGRALETETIRDGLWKDITYEGGEPDLAIGYRFRDNGFEGGAIDDLRIYDRALVELEAASLADPPAVTSVLSKPATTLTPTERSRLQEYFLAAACKSVTEFEKALTALRFEENRLTNPIPEAMAMVEMPTPKPAYLLKRGNYDMPMTAVSAATPVALSPFPQGQPRNRLGLARWLTSREHPLTARVTVNRVWQLMFGKGIVETSENFGSQGAQPTHPELLDWLACDFVDNGWDLKKLIRTMATSATYLQSSRVEPQHLAKDPNNQWLARMPARRLTAEMLRDQALFVSGLLTEKIGGPSVRPYQPDGLWEVAMSKPHYDQSHGPDLYRRSLYTFFKRTVPHPALAIFDAADRSNCAARRQSTNTPLQSLALLNDPQLVEAARFLGQRCLKEGGRSTAERCAWALRLVAARSATKDELTTLTALFDEQRAGFAKNPKNADQLLTVGEAKSDPSLDRVDLAAATVLSLTILNHDASTTRR